MKALRILGALFGLALGLLVLILAYLFVGWGWSDSLPAGWSPLQWTLAILPWSIPFLFSVWVVYKSLNSKWNYTLIAEVCLLFAAFLVVFAWARSVKRASGSAAPTVSRGYSTN